MQHSAGTWSHPREPTAGVYLLSRCTERKEHRFGAPIPISTCHLEGWLIFVLILVFFGLPPAFLQPTICILSTLSLPFPAMHILCGCPPAVRQTAARGSSGRCGARCSGCYCCCCRRRGRYSCHVPSGCRLLPARTALLLLLLRLPSLRSRVLRWPSHAILLLPRQLLQLAGVSQLCKQRLDLLLVGSLPHLLHQLPVRLVPGHMQAYTRGQDQQRVMRASAQVERKRVRCLSWHCGFSTAAAGHLSCAKSRATSRALADSSPFMRRHSTARSRATAASLASRQLPR